MRRREFALQLAGFAALGCSAGARLREPEDTGIVGATDSAAADAGLLCPTGTQGIEEGLVLVNETSVTGYRGGTGPFTPISMCEYYDPDGTRGINALWVIRSGVWCKPCADMSVRLKTWAPKYLARGARILEVLVEGATSELPATQKSVDDWIAKYGCPYDVARADHASFGVAGDPIPTSFFVDPRTMVIKNVHLGSDALILTSGAAQLETILKANGA